MAEKILVSACLVGNAVRYNAADVPCPSDWLDKWREEDRIVAFCPEVGGGLPVPRPPAEINDADGKDVIEGRAGVFDNIGNDVTEHFLEGARKALETAQQHQIKVAVLKEKSPSCGSSFIYDGKFAGNKLDGQGVTTALLRTYGIKVFSENEIEQAAQYLESLGRET